MAFKRKSKKIAMIGHKRVPSREGGVEVVVWELAKRLKKQGYEVDCYNRSDALITPATAYSRRKGKCGLYKNGIRLITVPTVQTSGVNAVMYSVLATVRAVFSDYQVIHYHAEGPCLMCWLPSLLGIRTIATIHGLDWQRSKWGSLASRMLRLGEWMAVHFADEVIVLSRSMQQYFLDTYGRKTRYIPNGIHEPVRREAQLITEKYGLKGDDYIYVLSRIVPEKGIHYLLQAFADVDSDVKLVIAGGSGNSDAYHRRIKKEASKNPNVIMTDFIRNEMLQEVCSNALLFVLPSDVEGMSLSLLEAMSYGNACLVSDIPENKEVVGEHAYVFAAGDVEELQEQIERVINNREEAHAIGEKAREYVLKTHDWDKMAMSTIRLYENVTSRGGRSSK